MSLEEISSKIAEGMATKGLIKEYQFVISNLLAQLGGSAEVPVLKYRSGTGELINPIPEIESVMDGMSETFTLRVKSGEPSTTAIPIVKSTAFRDNTMTFAGIIAMLQDLSEDYRSVFGRHIEEAYQLESAIALIESDWCLPRLKAGEPFFVLRAQDLTAWMAVNDWLERAIMRGAPLEEEKVRRVMLLIKEMQDWPDRRLPT